MDDVCRHCSDVCCQTGRLALFYVKSGKPVYRNNPQIRKFPFFHKARNDWICDRFDDKREGGHCSDYDNRPLFCRDYVCKEATEILALIQDLPVIERIRNE